MQHFPVTDINPTMAHTRRVIGAFEEHQITGFGRTGRRTDVIELSLIHIWEAVAITANIDHLLGHTDGRENKAQER